MRENNSTQFWHSNRVSVDSTTEIGKRGGKKHLKGHGIEGYFDLLSLIHRLDIQDWTSGTFSYSP